MGANNGFENRWKVADLREKIFDFDYELQVLNRLNLEALDELFQSSSADRLHYSTTVAGNFVDQVRRVWEKENVDFVLMQPAPLETILSYGIKQLPVRSFYPDSFADCLDKTDDVIVLNPALAESLLINDRLLRSLSRKVKSQFVFFLDNFFSSEISVVWRNGFSDPEQIGSHYFRCYAGQSDHAGLDLFNTLEYPVNCRIEFWVSSFDPNAEITFTCAGEQVKACPKTGGEHGHIHALLYPGYNKLSIIYSGKPIQHTPRARALKFTIIDLRIYFVRKNGEETCVSGDAAYHTVDDGERPVVLSDNQIRRCLHLNGFFEVDTFVCPAKESSLQKVATSRYHHIDLSFYYMTEPVATSARGIKIYVARRKGQIK